MLQERKLGEFPFSVEARVAIQLGRESISSSLIAISELVKNAYDADSDEVCIGFHDLHTSNPSMIISDDGIGMDDGTILNNWFRIGTTNKFSTRHSSRRRIYTGAKGLGRLGLDRLCSKLELYTKTVDKSSIYRVQIDWEKYSHKQTADLATIRHGVSEILASSLPENNFPMPGKQSGSQYVLSGLKDTWNAEYLSDLRQELALLVSPFSSDLGFKVKFDTKGIFPDLDGYITSDHFLEAAEWHLEARLTEKGTVTLEIYGSDSTLDLEMPPVPWSEWVKSNEKIPNCGPLHFSLYFMRNAKSARIDTNSFRSKDVKSFLKNNQGVRIYRDNFRVKPYGDPSGEGDWLGLAMRRVINPQSITMDNWRIGYNQIVGAVFIGREINPLLVDQTNREGLQEGRAYFDLRIFTLKCIELFERHIQKSEKKKKESTYVFETLSEAVEKEMRTYDAVLDSIGTVREEAKDQETKDKLIQIERTISEQSERAANFKERIDQLEAEKDTLANLASLGILSVSFGHETLASISNAIASSSLLKSKIESGMFMLPLDVVDFANKRFEQIDRSLQYIKVFGNFSLGNIRRDKRTRRNFRLEDVARNVLDSFDEMLKKRKIEAHLSVNVAADMIIRGYEIDWESIFANLITNSCWALSDTPASHRKILITISDAGDNCELIFEDSGKGIEPGTEEHIFGAAFSTKRNNKGDTIGTGMGLSIVKTFVEEHSKGKIQILRPGKLGGARFVITVPRSTVGV